MSRTKPLKTVPNQYASSSPDKGEVDWDNLINVIADAYYRGFEQSHYSHVHPERFPPKDMITAFVDHVKSKGIGEIEMEPTFNGNIKSFTPSTQFALSLGQGDKEGWVSVEERLPEHGQLIAYYRGGIEVPTVEADVASDEWFKFYDWIGVTHWMPLPQPPKQ